jgi:hypothetical protein
MVMCFSDFELGQAHGAGMTYLLMEKRAAL